MATNLKSWWTGLTDEQREAMAEKIKIELANKSVAISEPPETLREYSAADARFMLDWRTQRLFLDESRIASGLEEIG